MATHSSVLAWRIPGTGEPGGLPSVGSQSRIRLKWLSSSSRFTKNWAERTEISLVPPAPTTCIDSLPLNKHPTSEWYNTSVIINEPLWTHHYHFNVHSLHEGSQTVKRLPTMRETQVWSLGWEDPLEKDMAPHSSILAWKIPWTEDPGVGYSPWSLKESDTTERLHFNFHRCFSMLC